MISPVSLSRVELQTYTDDDFWLTEALETDPAVMRELGGPIERDKLPEIHRRRLADPWWFKIVAEPGGGGRNHRGVGDAARRGGSARDGMDGSPRVPRPRDRE